MFVWSRDVGATFWWDGLAGYPGPQNRARFVGAEVPRKFCGNLMGMVATQTSNEG